MGVNKYVCKTKIISRLVFFPVGIDLHDMSLHWDKSCKKFFFGLKTDIEPTFWNSLYSLGPSFPRIYFDSGCFSGAAFTNRQLISIFVLILNWVICHKGTGKQEQWKMAAIGSALLSSLGLTQAERAFRPWWDAIEDHIVYTIIILVCTSVSGLRSQDIKSNI